ncbi:hypothetical protein [Rhodoferax sp.]|uniref:hypothetical protein n=1 Tax=Rhodoferax sp. TaxID=50421 RepID=UPI00284BBD6E|nr:hypothetical protein [Rhodoferax sp.]MDR3370021.1 hypothetical protein [Rhodoferax sp.]
MFLIDLSLPTVKFAVTTPVESVLAETNCSEPDDAENVTVCPAKPTFALFLIWAVITAEDPADGKVFVDVNISTIAGVTAATSAGELAVDAGELAVEPELLPDGVPGFPPPPPQATNAMTNPNPQTYL